MDKTANFILGWVDKFAAAPAGVSQHTHTHRDGPRWRLHRRWRCKSTAVLTSVAIDVACYGGGCSIPASAQATSVVCCP